MLVAVFYAQVTVEYGVHYHRPDYTIAINSFNQAMGVWKLVVMETGTRRGPFNSTPMAANSGSPAHLHVHLMRVHRTCGRAGEIKKNTHPKMSNIFFRDMIRRGTSLHHVALPR